MRLCVIGARARGARLDPGQQRRLGQRRRRVGERRPDERHGVAECLQIRLVALSLADDASEEFQRPVSDASAHVRHRSEGGLESQLAQLQLSHFWSYGAEQRVERVAGQRAQLGVGVCKAGAELAEQRSCRLPIGHEFVTVVRHCSARPEDRFECRLPLFPRLLVAALEQTLANGGCHDFGHGVGPRGHGHARQVRRRHRRPRLLERRPRRLRALRSGPGGRRARRERLGRRRSASRLGRRSAPRRRRPTRRRAPRRRRPARLGLLVCLGARLGGLALRRVGGLLRRRGE
mmetsp:Transcript_28491/g.95934  ORF Transcript_28491/g.95934 Transcript_28491/m.95934 type:complete len:290 (-) Transcript_28491:1475-2344(-)